MTTEVDWSIGHTWTDDYTTFYSPIEQWQRLPTFLVIEYQTYFTALVALWHACKARKPVLWFGGVICGLANDAFFMWLPFCDNFWQARGTINITPRMPLYIPMIYINFMYYATIAASRLKLDPLYHAVASGLLGYLYYLPYDICGPRLLWWTWHDTDPAISQRLGNPPIGSMLWVINYTAVYSALSHWINTAPSSAAPQANSKAFSASSLRANIGAFGRQLQAVLHAAPALLQFAFIAAVATPTFMAVMGVFQLVSLDTLGIPGLNTIICCWFFYGVVVSLSVFKKLGAATAVVEPSGNTAGQDAVLYFACAVHFTVCSCCISLGDPARHVSTGMHQEVGDCSLKDYDIMGLERERFLCAGGPHASSAADYSVDCAHHVLPVVPPTPGATWYTVCGLALPQAQRQAEMARTIAVSILGAAFYAYCLVGHAANGGAIKRKAP